MAKPDPMNDALMKYLKSVPDALKKDGKSVKEAANLSKALKKQDKSFQPAIKKFLASLALDKKKLGSDAKAKKQIEALEKMATEDVKKRMTIVKMKIT